LQNADKVKIAHKVAEEQPFLDVLDLKEQMIKLINFIYKANGHKKGIE
jgi:hypothetical protein